MGFPYLTVYLEAVAVNQQHLVMGALKRRGTDHPEARKTKENQSDH